MYAARPAGITSSVVWPSGRPGKRAIRAERRRRDLAQRPVKDLGLVRAGAGRGDHQEDPGTAEDHAARRIAGQA